MLKSPILGGNLGLFGPLFVPDTCTPLGLKVELVNSVVNDEGVLAAPSSFVKTHFPSLKPDFRGKFGIFGPPELGGAVHTSILLLLLHVALAAA